MRPISYHEWVEFTLSLGRGPHDPGIIAYPGTAAEALQYCVRFFENPMPILATVSRERACEVLWIIPSIDGYGGLMAWPEFPFPDRARLADSQVMLFDRAFSKDGYDGTAFIWWELLIGAQWDDGPSIQDDRPMCDNIIAILERILDLPAEECVRSALHGLNEFGPNSSDPEAAIGMIHRLLNSGRPLSEGIRGYAMQVLAGEAQ